jgi:hypothetical protein
MECEDVRHVRPPSGEVIAKTGFEGGWVWSLPRCPTDPEDDRVL